MATALGNKPCAENLCQEEKKRSRQLQYYEKVLSYYVPIETAFLLLEVQL